MPDANGIDAGQVSLRGERNPRAGASHRARRPSTRRPYPTDSPADGSALTHQPAAQRLHGAHRPADGCLRAIRGRCAATCDRRSDSARRQHAQDRRWRAGQRPQGAPRRCRSSALAPMTATSSCASSADEFGVDLRTVVLGQFGATVDAYSTLVEAHPCAGPGHECHHAGLRGPPRSPSIPQRRPPRPASAARTSRISRSAVDGATSTSMATPSGSFAVLTEAQAAAIISALD